jgi:hypothetical protein
MRLAGYQPQYFPRLHYFARALDADIFALSDNVQFVRTHVYADRQGKLWRGLSYQAHTLIKTGNGAQKLGIHIRHEGLKPINQTLLNDKLPWPRKHTKGIQLSYARAPYGGAISDHTAKLLGQKYPSLATLNITTFTWALAWILGDQDHAAEHTIESINDLLQQPHPFRLKKVVVKSAAGIAPSDAAHDATDIIIATCQKLGADEYYAGGTARLAYLDEQRLNAAGIRLALQQWQLAPYRQQFPRPGFVPNISIIDLLANEDIITVQQLLRTDGS